MGNGNLHLEIPLYSLPERGGSSYDVSLIYDSDNWDSTTNLSGGINSVEPYQTYYYPKGTGWTIKAGDSKGGPLVQAYGATAGNQTNPCPSGDTGFVVVIQGWVVVDGQGTQHTIAAAMSSVLTSQHSSCKKNGIFDSSTTKYNFGGEGYAKDGSGYKLNVASDGATVTVYAPDGTVSHGVLPDITPQATVYNSWIYLPGVVNVPTTSETPNGNLYGYTGYPAIAGNSISTGSTILGYPSAQNIDICGQYAMGITSGSQVIDYENALQNPSGASHTYTLGDVKSCQAIFPFPSTLGEKFTFGYTYIPICSGPSGTNPSGAEYQYCGGMWALTSVTLPDTLGQYQFTYDSGTTYTPDPHFGTLTGITLPTGGTISYTADYSELAGCPGWTLPALTSITDNGGTTTLSSPTARTYPCILYPTTVTYPPHATTPGSSTMVQDSETISNTYNYNYSPPVSEPYIQSYTTQLYSGTTPLRTTVETVDWAGRPTSVSSTWNATNENHTVTYGYHAPVTSTGQIATNLIAHKHEYDSGVLVRSVDTEYLYDAPSIPYLSAYNMINYPTSQTLTDGAGNIVAQSQYAYDEPSYSNTSSINGPSGHDPDHGTSFYARGNLTTVSALVSPEHYLATHNSFDTLGNLVKKTDGNGNITQIGYKDNYLDSGCIGSAPATYALPTSLTDALNHTTTTAYYSCVGKPGWVQDANDLAANRYGATMSYDAAGRLHSLTTADGGGSTMNYPTPNEVDKTTLITATSSHSFTSILDEFGRGASVTDNSSNSETDTFYDLLGNINCTSNPHSNEPSSTDGLTCYSYDPLKRVTATRYPDSSQTTYTWNGNSVTTIDPLGISRTTTTDALGRLTLVLEPDGASNTPLLSTSYTYDAQNNLLSVSQAGAAKPSFISRPRRFTYDSLSRLVSATNPETGTVTYSYDGNGNVLTSTDARPVVATYTYDALNRVTSKTYNDANGTPSSCFQYDGASVTNGIGRLSSEWTQAGSCTSSAPGAWTKRSILAYDPMGRVASEQQATIASKLNGKSYAPQYTYDLAGDLTSSTDGITPAPVATTAAPVCAPTMTSEGTLTFVYCYDAAGRMQSLYSSWNDLAGHPAMLFSTPTYAAPGELVGATFGNGLGLSRTYDNRLRITNESDTSSAVGAATTGTALVTITGVEQYK